MDAMNRSPSLGRISAAASGLWRGRLARQSLMVVLPFGLQQFVRLVVNIILARLLAPEMFGFMILINVIRTGAEMLSDIGIGQSVVRSPKIDDREFLNTAWTLQVVRGAILTLIVMALAVPVSAIYGDRQSTHAILIVSVTFLITGLHSTELWVMQRAIELHRRAVYDIACTVLQSAATIALALIWPSIWALVWGVVASAVLSTVISYAIARGPLPRLTWRREYVHEILHFGKWIFLSTVVYFAAMNADRFYFSAALPLALVGIYGIARTFSDLLSALAQRLGAYLVMPKVIELRERRDGVADSFQHKRFLALAIIAAAMVFSLAASDALILLLYDVRYHAAAFMLPILLGIAWFSVLAAFDESTLYGLDRPKAGAYGNTAKFAVMIVGLPLAVPAYGILAGILVLLLAEMARWLVLSFALAKERLSSVAADVALTAAILVLAAALKLGLGAIGLVPDFHEWWALGRLVHG